VAIDQRLRVGCLGCRHPGAASLLIRVDADPELPSGVPTERGAPEVNCAAESRTGRRPRRVPWRRARAKPAMVRSTSRARSNSPKRAQDVQLEPPAAVERTIPSRSDMNATSRSCSSWTAVQTCARLAAEAIERPDRHDVHPSAPRVEHQAVKRRPPILRPAEAHVHVFLDHPPAAAVARVRSSWAWLSTC